MKKIVTLCGGGSLGHVLAGWLSARGHAEVNILTSRPEKWQLTIEIDTPDGLILRGQITKVSNKPEEVIPQSDIVLLCLPGFMICKQLESIKHVLAPSTFVGSVFCSTGFFFDALKILGTQQPMWGFQRVPFISRVNEYGKSAHLLGYKDAHNVAVENVNEKQKCDFTTLLTEWFERPIKLLKNYYEASLTNSNPLLHTSRLYTMFGGDNEGKIFDRMIFFYEEWTEEAADMYIKMDTEFFNLLKSLPVSDGYLPSVLEYYESHDAKSLAKKLSSIQGFKGITSPMKQVEGGWVPDFESRYFTEDFPHGLKHIWQLAHEKSIPCPNIDLVYEWGMSKINR